MEVRLSAWLEYYSPQGGQRQTTRVFSAFEVVMQYHVIHHQQSHRHCKSSKEVSAEKGTDPFEPSVVLKSSNSLLRSDWRFATFGAEAFGLMAGRTILPCQLANDQTAQRACHGKAHGCGNEVLSQLVGLVESSPPLTLPRPFLSKGPSLIVREGKVSVNLESLSAAPIASIITCKGVVMHQYSLPWTQSRF